MSHAVVAPGDKLHIITRRLFHDDLRRHFAGEITAAQGDLCQVRGYAFVFDSGSNEYRRRPEVRTRIVRLGSSGLIVNQLPRDLDVASLQYRVVNQRLTVTDSAGFSLDINEFGSLR